MKLLFQLSLFVIAVAACTQEPAPIETAPPTLVDSEEMTDTPADLALLSWRDLLSQDKPTPSTSIQIGEGETDTVDLWLPETPGPHPVVLMVHGGCWQKSVADRTLMNYAAEDLRQRGLAVWNIEYRGVDEDGGGYPGTYLDVARAADAIGRYAETYDLDPARVAGIGHSAGGHLVTWLATRAALPEGSPLISRNPQSLMGVINSGGLADLELSVQVTQFDCLGSIIDNLTGSESAERGNVFSDTSPAELLPVPGDFVSVSGAMDRISPPGLADEIVALDRAAGGSGRSVIVAGNNHVDLIAPGTAAWEAQATLL
ncbi:MAG: alpha/beta hydrolase, partial [Pseudomonadota bacterium]